MAHAYAWHGEEFDRAVDEAEAEVEMNPMTRRSGPQLAFYLANAGQFDKAMDWVSWAIAHDYRTISWKRPTPPGPITSPADTRRRCRCSRASRRRTHGQPLIIYVRWDAWTKQEPPSSEWRKTGPHSVLAEACTPIREPMKQKYLDDLRKAGMPEHAEHASP